VHLDQAQQAREAGASYTQATREDFTVWTEPGRGDVDLMAALADAVTFNGGPLRCAV
jgi:inosose dehydratase